MAVTGKRGGPVDGKPRRRSLRNDPERAKAVEAMWAAMVPAYRIARELAPKFDCAERTIFRDLEALLAKLRGARPQGTKLEERRDQLRAAFDDLYRKALLDKDWRAAGMALDRLGKLDGLFAPEQVEVQHGGKVQVDVAERSSQSRRARVAELMAKAKQLAGEKRALPAPASEDDAPPN